jgi:hypothetical protein
MFKKTVIILILVFVTFLINSCATIIFGFRQKVEIFSIPDSCTVYLNGENTNRVTPAKLRVKRRVKSTFYNERNELTYILKKDGYDDFEIKDKAKFNPWVIGNTVLSGAGVGANAILPIEGSDDSRVVTYAIGFPIIGAVIDGASGSYNKYQSRVFAELKPKAVIIKQSDISKPGNVSSGGGLALCIGNGNYLNVNMLSNPENDAMDMADALKSLGYTVMMYTNLNQADMKKAIDLFGNELKNYKVGLFFYAGHGIQAKGINYLIPVDASISGESDVEYTCVDAGRVLGKMESAGSSTNIVLLDACRNNPFERSWTRSTQGRGLAVMDAPVGSLIGFATSPGNTASDGAGRNGLYTSAILKYINEPDVSIIELFQKVRKTVRESSLGQQTPWESTSLEGNYYFNRK